MMIKSLLMFHNILRDVIGEERFLIWHQAKRKIPDVLFEGRRIKKNEVKKDKKLFKKKIKR